MKLRSGRKKRQDRCREESEHVWEDEWLISQGILLPWNLDETQGTVVEESQEVSAISQPFDTQGELTIPKRVESYLTVTAEEENNHPNKDQQSHQPSTHQSAIRGKNRLEEKTSSIAQKCKKRAEISNTICYDSDASAAVSVPLSPQSDCENFPLVSLQSKLTNAEGFASVLSSEVNVCSQNAGKVTDTRFVNDFGKDAASSVLCGESDSSRLIQAGDDKSLLSFDQDLQSAKTKFDSSHKIHLVEASSEQNGSIDPKALNSPQMPCTGSSDDLSIKAIGGTDVAINLFQTGSEKSLDPQPLLGCSMNIRSDNSPSMAVTKSDRTISLFQTGSGKDICVSPKALQRAQELFLGSPKDDTNVSINKNDEVPSLFQTGSGKNVDVTAMMLKAAQVANKNPTSNRSRMGDKSAAEPQMFSLFQTGSGKDIQVDPESLRKAHAAFSKEEHKLDVETTSGEGRRTMSIFQTGTGKNISVDEQILNRAWESFNENALVDVTESGVPIPTMSTKDKSKKGMLNRGALDDSKDIRKSGTVSIIDLEDETIQCTQPTIARRDAERKRKSFGGQLCSGAKMNRNIRRKSTGTSLGHSMTSLKGAGIGKRRNFKAPSKKLIIPLGIPETQKSLIRKPLSKSLIDTMETFEVQETCTLKELLHQECSRKSEDSVPEDILRISWGNADSVYFDADGMPTLETSCGVSTFKTIHQMLKTKYGISENNISSAWVKNHFRQIVWKLACTERMFWDRLRHKYLTMNQVVFQLIERYNIEVLKNQRPCLRKILQRDDSEAKFMVLCVASVLSPDEQKDYTSGANIPQLILTDGWYSVLASVDMPLQELLHRGRITVGTKLAISGARIQGFEDGVDPMECAVNNFSTRSMPVLMLHCNGTRFAHGHARMGFQSNQHRLTLPLRSLTSNAGVIPEIDVLVKRLYPRMYLETMISGFKRILSSEEEDVSAKTYNEDRQTEYARQLQQLQKEKNLDADQWFSSNNKTKLLDELKSRLEISHPLRKSVPFVRFLITCAYHPNNTIEASLTLWSPPEDLHRDIQEGKRYRITDCNVSGKLYGLKLNCSRSSQWTELAIEPNILDVLYTPRIAVPVAELLEQNSKEVDVVVFILETTAMEQELSLDGAKVWKQFAFVTDSTRSLMSIEFTCYENTVASRVMGLKPGTCVGICNLKICYEDKNIGIIASKWTSTTCQSAQYHRHLYAQDIAALKEMMVDTADTSLEWVQEMRQKIDDLLHPEKAAQTHFAKESKILDEKANNYYKYLVGHPIQVSSIFETNPSSPSLVETESSGVFAILYLDTGATIFPVKLSANLAYDLYQILAKKNNDIELPSDKNVTRDDPHRTVQLLVNYSTDLMFDELLEIKFVHNLHNCIHIRSISSVERIHQLLLHKVDS